MADKHDGESSRGSCSCTGFTEVLFTCQIYVLIRHQMVIPLLPDEAVLSQSGQCPGRGGGTQGCPSAETPSMGTPGQGAAARGNWELCVLEERILLDRHLTVPGRFGRVFQLFFSVCLTLGTGGSQGWVALACVQINKLSLT